MKSAHIKLYIIGIFISSALHTMAQSKKKPTTYQFVNTITLDVTPIKNQQRTGTCWSYSTISFIESELIRMGKPEIDLSEMYPVYMNYTEKQPIIIYVKEKHNSAKVD